MDDRHVRAARTIYDDQRAKRPIGRLAGGLHPRDLAEAYQVQDCVIALYQAGGFGPIAGWKIALTAKVQQQRFNVNHPFEGAMFASLMHASPRTEKAADYLQLGAESEIVLKLGRDLPGKGTPYTRADMAEAVDACMAGIEIADLRDFAKSPIDATVLVSDNAMARGCVAGPAIREWRTLDLGAARCRMIVNGQVVGEGHGRDALGHPMEALAWLANRLVERGTMLKAGHLVMTGSLVPARALKPGETLVTEIEGLGEARLIAV
ncbi:MAG: hydratase [Alphaproteobacteria bacterium]|nr:hydratase [Alphaproteobacteria bacterium]